MWVTDNEYWLKTQYTEQALFGNVFFIRLPAAFCNLDLYNRKIVGREVHDSDNSLDRLGKQSTRTRWGPVFMALHIEENKMKRIYQRATYESQMRDAWSIWGERLNQLDRSRSATTSSAGLMRHR